MTSGSRKGGAFERRCAKMLSLYLTDGESDSELIRSVSSGGWSRRKVLQVGDLAPNGPVGEQFRRVFGIECKNRQSFDWHHLWTSGAPELLSWWQKHRDECQPSRLVPLMLYTRNYQPIYLVYPSFLDRLPSVPSWSDQYVGMFVRLREQRDDGIPLYDLTAVPWEVFAAAVTPEHLLRAGRLAAEGS